MYAYLDRSHQHQYTEAHTRFDSVPSTLPIISRAPGSQQLCRIKNKERHGAGTINSIKRERAPRRSHHGRLDYQIENIGFLMGGICVTFVG